MSWMKEHTTNWSSYCHDDREIAGNTKKRKTVFVKIHAENQMTANMFRKHNDILLRPCLVKGFVKRVSRRS